jgi:hypothetical protein
MNSLDVANGEVEIWFEYFPSSNKEAATEWAACISDSEDICLQALE